MEDETEAIRRQELQTINAVPGERAALEAQHGQVWSTEELRETFECLQFMAPLVVVRRRSDSQRGTLWFQHHPRYYWGFEAEDAR